jgi:cytoskeletal protein RodZ
MSSCGEDLKRERDLRKISLREIAESTKINVRYLDALEKNNFKHLPGGVFNKGFVRAFAQHIGVDEEDMVNAYLLEEQAQNIGPGMAEGAPIRGNFGERFTDSGESRGDPGMDRGRKRFLLTMAAVLAAIVVLAGGWWILSSRIMAVPEQTGQPEITVPSPEPDRSATDPPADQAKEEKDEEEPVAVEKENADLEPAPVEERPPGPLEVEITLARPTNGRLNCDNRQVELLDRLAAGITLGFHCDRFLLIDADDGGALLIKIGGGEPTPLAGDGVPLRQYRLTPENRVE